MSKSICIAAVLCAFAFASTLIALPNPTHAQPNSCVFEVVMVEDLDGDPIAAGKQAGEQLLEAMGDAQLKAVFISECFEDREYKEELMEGLREALPAELLIGGATYGSFTQDGCTDFDAVSLLGIGGPGIQVDTAIVTEMGTSKLSFEEDEPLIKERLHAAGKDLANQIERTDDDALLIVFGDAHSPKVQYLVEGVQQSVGPEFPITGGCANKNAGQTFVYYKGEFYEDAAVAIMLSGDFDVALTGRQAMEEQAVIDTAYDGATEAIETLAAMESPEPRETVACFAFNCAGRRGKLTDYQDELDSIQRAIGEELPLFGCYCAGEIGPINNDTAREGALSGGDGWHVMYALIRSK